MEEEEKNDVSASKMDDAVAPPVLACALCGCSTPAVRCDRCNSQIFCLSCDDMYHRHPKRKLHLRKAVDSIWSSSRSPRIRRRTDLPGDPSKIPIPPPRSKKRDRHIGVGRSFLKNSHELGSFGYSKVFDTRSISPLRNNFAGQKSLSQNEETYENQSNFQNKQFSTLMKPDEIYENDNVTQESNLNNLDRSPWNSTRPNIASPIQVSIPPDSPSMVTNGQPFSQKQQSRSTADLGAPPHSMGPYPYPYPFMHQAPHSPYSHSAGHLNCGQCLSSSWSNLMSPHPSPFFHPLPWGTPVQGTMPFMQPFGPTANGNRKSSQGDLPAFPDPNFPYMYPPSPFYPNGGLMNSNAIQQAAVGAHKLKRSREASPKSVPNGDSKSQKNTEIGSNSPADPAAAAESQGNQESEDPKPSVPQVPWSCAHCTFINPAGVYICQVCCKTSYRTDTSKSETEEETRARNHGSSSPMELVNMDAEANSHFSDYANTLKVT